MARRGKTILPAFRSKPVIIRGRSVRDLQDKISRIGAATAEGMHWYRIYMPPAVQIEIPIKGRHICLAADDKIFRFAVNNCSVDDVIKTPLRYMARFDGNKVDSIYVTNLAPNQRFAYLEVFKSNTPLEESLFPVPSIDEPIPRIAIYDYDVPNTRANAAAIVVVPYVFRSIEISCPIPDLNVALAVNTTPVYMIFPLTPLASFGRQFQPGAAWQADFTSPIWLGFYAGLPDQIITFTGLHGALNPIENDSIHADAPSFITS